MSRLDAERLTPEEGRARADLADRSSLIHQVGTGETDQTGGVRGTRGVRARVPLWQQISDDMRAAIESGQITPGQLLPSEAQLRQRYHVSIRPVRQAMEDLRSAGLVLTEHGRGSIVCEQNPTSLTFNPFITRTPDADRFTVWDSAWRLTHRELLHDHAGRHAPALACPITEPVVILERHLLDPTGHDVIIHRVVHRRSTLEELGADDTHTGWEPAQLYTLLTPAWYPLDWNDQITADHATGHDIDVMAIPRGAPVLLHTRTIRSASGHPLAVEETRLPGLRTAIASRPLQ